MSATTQNQKSIEEQQQVFQNATITATKSAVKRLKGVMATDGTVSYTHRKLTPNKRVSSTE